MLVLSRRKNEKVVFPNLGISIQVIRVSGNKVRLGIDAPPDVRILRDEIAEVVDDADNDGPHLSRKLRHELRNRLNTASLGLQLLHRRMEEGEVDDAESTIFKIFGELREIDSQLQRTKQDEHAEQPRDRRALIVDDCANESELLAAYLRMSGYEVDTVSDGLEAIAYLKKNERPDAVLLDMCMPRLDGPKTITSIRCEPELEGLKIFGVSGTDRQDLGVELGPQGVDRWFSKPVNAREIVQELSNGLGVASTTA